MENAVTDKELEIKHSTKSSNVCPDYDDDCVDVADPLLCWMGNESCDRAQGLCPMIHTNN